MKFTPQTIPSLFFHSCNQFSDQTAFQTNIENKWHDISYQEAEKQTINLAKGLLDLGVQKEDRVGIFASNCPEWVMLDIAIQSIGAITVPIYSTLNVSQAQAIIDHAGIKVLFADVLEKLQEINTDQLSTKVFMDETDQNAVVSWSSFFERSGQITDKTFFLQMKDHHPDQVASIVYTSGTTGDPKGVMLTQKNITSNTLASLECIPINHTDISVSFLPLSHMFERVAGCYCLLAKGATMAFCPNINKITTYINEVQPTLLITVPRLLEKVYQKVWDKMRQESTLIQKLFQWALRTTNKHPLFFIFDKLFFQKIRNQLGGRLRFIISGGAALSNEIYLFLDHCGLCILQGYGLTETSPVASVNRPDQKKSGTVGPPLPGVEIKISSEQEVLIKGPNVMKGYYKNPEETQAVMTEDDFFKTGDIGEIDEDGYLMITDRLKDLIVTSGGKKVAPLPIENQLVASRWIDQACLVGEGRKTIGALIVPAFESEQEKNQNQDANQNEALRHEIQQVIDRVNENLSQYQKIKCFHVLNEEFSLDKEEITPTLKLRRKVIYERYKEMIDAMLPL